MLRFDEWLIPSTQFRSRCMSQLWYRSLYRRIWHERFQKRQESPLGTKDTYWASQSYVFPPIGQSQLHSVSAIKICEGCYPPGYFIKGFERFQEREKFHPTASCEMNSTSNPADPGAPSSYQFVAMMGRLNPRKKGHWDEFVLVTNYRLGH